MALILDGSLGITTPAETVQGALTTTGNTILGDASTDTLNVGNGGLVKDASGNVGIGRTSSTYKLEIAANNNGVALYGSAGTASSVYLAANGNTPGTTSLDILQGGDNQGYVYNRANAALNFGTNNTTQAAITASGLLQFNSGYGSVATAYGCRAWVNFNGTGTVAIRASGNVSSITDNGTGDYTVNFTTAMPDANYSFSGFGDSYDRYIVASTLLAGSLRILVRNQANTPVDMTQMGAQITR